MDILIIGNGFDLAHGLPTNYTDFIKYYSNKENMEKSESDISKYINAKNWFEYFKENSQWGNTWIDFETEIYNFIANLYWELGVTPVNVERVGDIAPFNHIKLMNEHFIEDNKKITKDEFDKIKEQIKQYKQYQCKCHNYISCWWENSVFITRIYRELIMFENKFAIYCCNVIDKQQVKPVYDFKKITNNGIDYLVSFNYTNTFKRLYPYIAQNTKQSYVHGNCNDKNKEIIFGTQSFDRSEKGVDKKLPLELNIFEKYTQRHLYNTIAEYQDMLNDMYLQCTPQKRKQNKIHIIGHSLDKTDHGLLKAIFGNSGQCPINVYYHDFRAQEAYIKNMRDIIGEDEVTRRVRFIDTWEIMTEEGKKFTDIISFEQEKNLRI